MTNFDRWDWKTSRSIESTYIFIFGFKQRRYLSALLNAVIAWKSNKMEVSYRNYRCVIAWRESRVQIFTILNLIKTYVMTEYSMNSK